MLRRFHYIHYIFDIFLITVVICIYFFGVGNTSKNIGRLGAEVYNKVTDGVEGIEEGFNKNKENKSKLFSKLSKFFEDYKSIFAYVGLIAILVVILVVIYKLVMLICGKCCGKCCNS